MAYVTAVTDRAQSDIDTPTSKGHFNVSDWVRIYDNARLANDMAEILLDAVIAFGQVTTVPTVNTKPDVADFNTLLTNIETLRLAMLATLPALTTSIKADYVAGADKQTFDFNDVNLWESVIDDIWNACSGLSDGTCPTLTADKTITTGNVEIYIDCLDLATYDLDLQGTAKLIII